MGSGSCKCQPEEEKVTRKDGMSLAEETEKSRVGINLGVERRKQILLTSFYSLIILKSCWPSCMKGLMLI